MPSRDETVSRRRVLQSASGTTVIGLAGCLSALSSGGDDHGGDGHSHGGDSNNENGGHSEAIGEPVEDADVSMATMEGGQHFEPHIIRLKKGGSVTWTLESGSHSTTSYSSENDEPQLIPDGAAAWDSGLVSEEGATFEHTFETEGVYHYYCTPHETMGMIGSVVVGQPDLQDQPALEDPPSDKSEAVRDKLAELNKRIRNALGGSN